MAGFAVTACVLLRRHRADAAHGADDQWLLSVRREDADYAPGRIGLIGGHLEPDDGPEDALEHAALRELREETGIDLTGTDLTGLRYLASARFSPEPGAPSVDVTYVADAPPGTHPHLSAPDELSAVGWWSLTELAADERTPEWLLELIRQAAAVLA